MISIIISGAAGRMGQAIARCALEDNNVSISGAVESTGHDAVGKNLGDLLGESNLTVTVSGRVDELPVEGNPVLIEFTFPEPTMEHLPWAREKGVPMVIGTTALSDDQKSDIERAAAVIPICFAPNMSVGVNLLFKLVEQAAKTLSEGYDVEIVETHHRFKKDSPSGTAVRLAEIVAAILNRDLGKDGVYGRKGMIGKRKASEIGIHAIRAGDVVGEHTVTFVTLGERIELTHKAHSRNTFALGALRAAKFLANKERGLFSMTDVLGLG